MNEWVIILLPPSVTVAKESVISHIKSCSFWMLCLNFFVKYLEKIKKIEFLSKKFRWGCIFRPPSKSLVAGRVGGPSDDGIMMANGHHHHRHYGSTSISKAVV